MTQSEELPTYFTKDYFKTALEYGLRQQDLRIRDIDVQKMCLGGENYCSNIYNAVISYSQGNNEEQHDKSIFIKSMPKKKQAALAALQIYLRETVFYLDIKPKLETLMWHTKGAPWNLGARHIYSTTFPDETIIFEDLRKIGYELKSRQLGLDLEHSRLVLQKLAEYHALTMIMSKKEPETLLKRYPFGLLNEFTIKSPNLKELSGAQFLKLGELIEKFPGYEEIAEKLRAYFKNFEVRLHKAVYPLQGAINVLNHGDLWVNNLFFKYAENRKPIEVEFLCYWGSPGFDINYFLITSVQLEVLKIERCTLIDVYYETFVETLKQLHYKQAIPSYETLINEIQTREAYGLFAAITFFPLMSMASVGSKDVSLKKLEDPEFVNRKIEFMYTSNPRTLQTLLYLLRRANDMGILD